MTGKLHPKLLAMNIKIKPNGHYFSRKLKKPDYDELT